MSKFEPISYRGRVAPTPTGLMHLGHARTFLVAQERARMRGGTLLLRVEDLDGARCKAEFVEALFEDLAWAGLNWDEGPDRGGKFGPYRQSERIEWYLRAWKKLRERGVIYPCRCSRKDVQEAIAAPHADGGELVYPGTCREAERTFDSEVAAGACNWRFRVPDGRRIEFRDGNVGEKSFVAGVDFGDFLVWRKDGIPSYELAVVTDDIAMEITEVVRGEDLLMSTARQLLLYEALGVAAPGFFHCPLVKDDQGRRLAKRDKAMGLREMRARGVRPAELMDRALI